MAAVETRYEEVKSELEAAKSVKDECNDVIKQAKADSEGFYGIMKAYEAEQIVAELLANDKNPINIESMSISGPSPISITPYEYTPTGSLDTPTVNPIEISKEEETAGGVIGNVNNAVVSETVGSYNYSISFIDTKKEDLYNFLDKIPTSNNKFSLVVNNVSIGDFDPDENGKDEASEKIEGSISFTLYFVNILDVDNVDELLEKATAGAAEDAAE